MTKSSNSTVVADAAKVADERAAETEGEAAAGEAGLLPAAPCRLLLHFLFFRLTVDADELTASGFRDEAGTVMMELAGAGEGRMRRS
jgi:hypothetical protein